MPDKQRVDELFARLVALPLEEQQRILNADGVTGPVRKQVEALLAADREARTNFLKPIHSPDLDGDRTQLLQSGNPNAARVVLLATIGAQFGFIAKEQSRELVDEWIADKSKSPEELLGLNALCGEERELLEALVQKLLARSEGDPFATLAFLSDSGVHANILDGVNDSDVSACVSIIGTASGSTFTTPASRDSSRYRVLRPHARGGLGEVFVAHDEELSREVALKEIQTHATNPDNQKRFMREAQITGSLEHPGIVPIYGLGTYGDGRPYYAMRFIHGDSLKAAIKEFHAAELTMRDRPVRFRELLQRFIDVCNAIHYAHTRGVLHRDLKPGNIMLGEFGETLVVDWGLARLIGDPEDSDLGKSLPADASDSATRTGDVVGTLAFMSPEQAAGKTAELGVPSDIYSLGATLYSLLTGRNPFAAGDLESTLAGIRGGIFPKPREVSTAVPNALEAICLKAMNVDPKHRYASASELRDEISRYLADEPVRAYREPAHQRCFRWARHHKTLATSLFVAVALASLAGAGFMEMQRRTQERELNQEIADTTDKVLTADLASVPAVADLPKTIREPVSLSLDRRLANATADQQLRINLARLDRAADRDAVLAQITRLPLSSLVKVAPVLQRDHPFFSRRLWEIARNEEEFSELQQRRVLAVLAQMDPDSSEWAVAPGSLASICTSGPVEQADLWYAAFKPIMTGIQEEVESLTTKGKDDNQSLVALRFVANSASAEALVALAVQLEPNKLGEVAKPIQEKIRECKPLLAAVANEQLPTKPLVATPNQPFPVPPESIASKLRHHFGAITESFAFAQTVRLAEVDGLNEALAECGYRPVSFRPFVRENGLAASIVWHRDGRGFRVIYGHSQESFDEQVTKLSTGDGLAPLDVTIYQDELGQIQFSGLWEERRAGDPDRIIRTAMAGSDVGKIRTDLRVRQKFQPFRVSEALDRTGRCYRAGVFEKREGTVLLDVFEESSTYDGLCLSGDYTDLRLFPTWVPPSEEFADLILSASALINSSDVAQQKKGLARFAAGHHRFRNFDAAIQACNDLLKLEPDRGNEMKRLALLHAARGDRKEAEQWMESYIKDRSTVVTESLKLRVNAILGKRTDSAPLMDSVAKSESVDELVGAASALAETAGYLNAKDPEFAGKLLEEADRLVSQLGEKLTPAELRDRLNTSFGIQGCTWNPTFAKVVRKVKLPHRIDCVYRLRAEHESKILAPGTLNREKCNELVEQGFIPVVLNSYDVAGSDQPISNSVWIRYFPTYDETSTLAKRKGNATALLLRTAELDWRELDDTGMNAATNEALQFLAPDPLTLLTEYRDAPANSDRRCNLLTVLGLSASDPADRVELDNFADELLFAYPETENHRLVGCIEWFLRKQNRGAELTRLQSSLRREDPEVTDDSWYVNKFLMRMVRVEPGELIIGARTNEGERFHLPATFSLLTQTRERTRYPIYVAAREVTLKQYREFAAERGVNLASNIKTAVPTEECSVTTVSMVNAAHFCNWLSETAGIPEDQWCYLPNANGEYAVGMRPAPNFKQRVGYRLPDEVEWELFARAGTTTIFYWGDRRREHYMHAEVQNTVPPGQFLPNPLGLFDILGNAAERCQSTNYGKFSSYRAIWAASHTDEAPWSRNQPFSVRGSFDNPISTPWPKQCMNEQPGLGLRVVRTAKP